MPVSLSAGETLVSAKLPNRAQMVSRILHSGLLYRIAVEAHARSTANESNQKPRTDDALIAIVFAAASAEGYINEVAERVSLHGASAANADLQTLAAVLEDAESHRLSPETKFVLAKKFLAGVVYEKGKPPLQDFVLLSKVRNAIVHLRPGIAFEPSDIEQQENRLTRSLVGKGLLGSSPSDDPLVTRLSTSVVAGFSCNAAAAIIRDIEADMPQDGKVAYLACAPAECTQDQSRGEGLYPFVSKHDRE